MWNPFSRETATAVDEPATWITRRYRTLLACDGLPINTIVDVIGSASEHEQFVAEHPAKPILFDGVVELAEAVKQIDVRGPSMLEKLPVRNLPDADVQTQLGWTPTQQQMAIDHLGFPKGQTLFSHDQLGRPTPTHRAFRSDAIESWLEKIRFVFPTLGSRAND